MTPTTVFFSGSEPLVRDGATVPVVYTVLPDNVHPGSYIYVGDDKFLVERIDHILSTDGAEYVRTLVHCRRDAVKKVKVNKTRKLKLTPRKI